MITEAQPTQRRLNRRHVLGLEGWTRDEIEVVLRNAVSFQEVLNRPVRKVPTLRGRSIVNLFYEPSTRTRGSFELAAKILSADAINLTGSASSVVKGESLKDTALTLQAMRADLIVVRHPMSGAAHFLASQVGIPVINAGDGMHEHPTQGLLDLLTLTQAIGDLEGKRVSIIGDIMHSRVARSDIWGLTAMGASVHLCAPQTLMPLGVDALPVTWSPDLADALKEVDAIILLRIQLERQKEGLFPTLREYSERWGLSQAKLAGVNQRLVIMHPGPINRGVEISDDLADAGHTLIEAQVTNGLAVRMALLYLLLGGEDEG